MSKYINTINYFSSLAQSDSLLRHEKTDANGLRQAFISISDEEELMADLIQNLAENFAVQVGFNGSKNNADGSVIDTYVHTLRFYCKAVTDVFDQPAKELAYDTAFNICQHWQQKIMNDAISGNGCGTLAFIDLGSFVGVKLPQLYNAYFGFQLTFTEQAADASYLLPDNTYWI